MKTNYKICAMMLLAASPLSHAFVSYSDPAPLNTLNKGGLATLNTLAAKTSPALSDRGERAFFVSPPECRDKVGIVDLDMAPRKIAHTTTRGANILLSTALRSILPKGWHADKSSDVDFNLLLSWEKGEVLTDVLTAIAFKHKLSVQISWQRKKIHIRSGCEKTPELNQPMASAPASVSPPIQQKPVVHYSLHAGQQMSDALREWCKTAKYEKENIEWTLIWEASKDQPIEADSHYGDHLEDAIAKLQNTIIGNNLPLRVYQWNNHVIKVTN